jgi:hypothetical protein
VEKFVWSRVAPGDRAGDGDCLAEKEPTSPSMAVMMTRTRGHEKSIEEIGRRCEVIVADCGNPRIRLVREGDACRFGGVDVLCIQPADWSPEDYSR